MLDCDHIRALLLDLGWNFTVLAERTGIKYQEVLRIMSGKRRDPRISTVKKLADGLGVSIEDLLEDHGK